MVSTTINQSVMKANQSELIKDAAKRILTAKGQKLKWQFIDKAAAANGTSRYDNKPAFKAKKEKMHKLFEALVFEQMATYGQLIDLLKKIEINKPETIQVATNDPFFV